VQLAWPLVDVLLLEDSTYGFTLLISPNLDAKPTPGTRDEWLALDPVLVIQWLHFARAVLDSARSGSIADRSLHGTLPLPAAAGRDSLYVIYDPRARRERRYSVALLGPPPHGMRVFTTPSELDRLVYALDSVATVNARRPRPTALQALPDNTRIVPASVQTSPALLWAPAPVYPPAARTAGRQGRVFLKFVLDTTGRVDLATLKVLLSDGADFEASARAVLARAEYRPARIYGQAVRVVIQQAFTFRMARH
jgi:TonB family protein